MNVCKVALYDNRYVIVLFETRDVDVYYIYTYHGFVMLSSRIRICCAGACVCVCWVCEDVCVYVCAYVCVLYLHVSWLCNAERPC